MKIITKRDRKNDIDAVGQCDNCNKEVELAGLVNACECGANYNWSGQRQVDNPDYSSTSEPAESEEICWCKFYESCALCFGK